MMIAQRYDIPVGYHDRTIGFPHDYFRYSKLHEKNFKVGSLRKKITFSECCPADGYHHEQQKRPHRVVNTLKT